MYILKVAKLEEASEELRPFIKEVKNGEVTELAVDLVPKAKLNEFRENNVAIAKERDALKTANDNLASVAKKIAGDKQMTPAEMAARIDELTATAQKVADGTLKGSDVINKEVETRTAAMKAAYDEQIQNQAKELRSYKEANEALDNTNKRMQVDWAVGAAAADEKLGLNMSAMPDIMARASRVFVMEDGKIIPKENGVIIRGEDGIAPMTIPEWFKQLKQTAPYFFKGSTGGGAAGGAVGEAQYAGLSKAEFDKLPVAERLKHANRQQAKAK